MRAVSKKVQQYRVDKYLEEQRQQIEYEAIVEYAQEIMAQTEAVFLFSLKLHGYGPKRLKEAHKHFIEVLEMPAEVMGKENTTNIILKLMEEQYDIDFSQIQPHFPSYEKMKAHAEEN